MGFFYVLCKACKPNSVLLVREVTIIYLGLHLRAGSGELPFRIHQKVEALLLHQVGFTTRSCHHDASIVVFDSRAKTSIHFSPLSFACAKNSIVSVALSRSLFLRTKKVGVTHYRYVMPCGSRVFGLSSRCLENQATSDHPALQRTKKV